MLDLYLQVIIAAEELTYLNNVPPAERTEDEKQRYAQLQAQKEQLSTDFSVFLELEEVSKALANLRTSTEGQSLEPDSFRQLKGDLATLPTKTALLYPLILPDRLELVLVLPGAEPIRQPIDVSSTDLNRAVVDFGQALKDQTSNPKPLAQKLYSWLIAPLDETLRTAGIKTLLYASDGALRYIPLAALHDGDQWLAERFSVTNITAISLTDFSDKPSDELRMFAGACVDCSFTFNVNDRDYQFSDLPATEREVNALNDLVGADTALNQDFSPERLKEGLNFYNVLHLATHAAFVNGAPRESFIVFGNGTTANMTEVGNWDLTAQDLIVLSACQTAVGSSILGDGVEILGLGHKMQEAGAKSSLASLWTVSDSGTQQLMDAFYSSLLQEGMTKTEALQQAQIALIKGEFPVTAGERASIQVIDVNTNQPIGDNLSHPYYWAPFILIGNGL